MLRVYERRNQEGLRIETHPQSHSHQEPSQVKSKLISK
jgi:hypothetical protein